MLSPSKACSWGLPPLVLILGGGMNHLFTFIPQRTRSRQRAVVPRYWGLASAVMTYGSEEAQY